MEEGLGNTGHALKGVGLSRLRSSSTEHDSVSTRACVLGAQPHDDRKTPSYGSGRQRGARVADCGSWGQAIRPGFTSRARQDCRRGLQVACPAHSPASPGPGRQARGHRHPSSHRKQWKLLRPALTRVAFTQHFDGGGHLLLTDPLILLSLSGSL